MCYMQMSLVSLEQENLKKSKKLMTIVKIEEKNFKSSEQVEEFQLNLQERCNL